MGCIYRRAATAHYSWRIQHNWRSRRWWCVGRVPMLSAPCVYSATSNRKVGDEQVALESEVAAHVFLSYVVRRECSAHPKFCALYTLYCGWGIYKFVLSRNFYQPCSYHRDSTVTWKSDKARWQRCQTANVNFMLVAQCTVSSDCTQAWLCQIKVVNCWHLCHCALSNFCTNFLYVQLLRLMLHTVGHLEAYLPTD